MKKFICLFLAIILACTLVTPALACDTAFAGRKNVLSIPYSHGYRHSDNYIVDSSGKLWALDNGEKEVVMTGVSSVSCDSDCTLVIKSDGSLWGWGYVLINGQEQWVEMDSPVKIMTGVKAVSSGLGVYCVIKKDNSLWVWGYGDHADLTPTRRMENVTACATTEEWCGALTSDGTLYALGVNGYAPEKLMENVISFGLYEFGYVAVTRDGKLWIIREYYYGDRYVRELPIKITEDVAEVAVCNDYGYAYIKTNGDLYVAASNTFGEQGQGHTENLAGGSDMKAYLGLKVPGLKNVREVAIGDSSVLAATSDGSVYAWGEAEYTCSAGNDTVSIRDGGGADATGPVYIDYAVQTVPVKISGVTVKTSALQKTTSAVERGTAYANTQMVLVDDEYVEFEVYALKDENGFDTNYIKLRDIAYILRGRGTEFNVTWDGAVNIIREEEYVPTGNEMFTPYSGDRPYTKATSETKVDGIVRGFDAILLTDDNGGGYTYYKLRDLGKALGFNVSWSGDLGICIDSYRAYQGD